MCVEYICKYFNISVYAFDITKQCFSKYISTSRNYPALVYYCINNHMYWISDREDVLSLTREARDIESKLKSCVFDEDKVKKNIYDGRTIYEDIPIEELMQAKYKDSIIIYNKTNLNKELDKIIELYHCIPDGSNIKNQKSKTTSITIKQEKGNKNKFLKQNIHLVIDPNDTHIITYKDIKTLCEKHDVAFKNQSFGSLIKELRANFYNKSTKRIKRTAEERATIHKDCGGCCNECKKEITTKEMQIDHVKPLAEGGTEDKENLQVLCNQERTRTWIC